jgi:hypothetical protein
LRQNRNSTDLDFLAGVRVVDFTQFEASPSCTEVLAWLGAEVVKIENPKIGEPGRRLHPGQPDDDPCYFHLFNANKKSITVKLKFPGGLEIVKDLLREADICVENMGPGRIGRLGLGYDDVKALNPLHWESWVSSRSPNPVTTSPQFGRTIGQLHRGTRSWERSSGWSALRLLWRFSVLPCCLRLRRLMPTGTDMADGTDAVGMAARIEVGTAVQAGMVAGAGVAVCSSGRR